MGGMDVSETLLPGVGMRYEFVTKADQRVGIVVHRDGAAELFGYRADDPDASVLLFELNEDEAETVAEILGGPHFARTLVELNREIPGLHTESVSVPATSRFVGQTLGDTRCRSVTGASVLALGRGDEIIAAPQPSQVLLAGDKLVIAGTRSGVAKARALLETRDGS